MDEDKGEEGLTARIAHVNVDNALGLAPAEAIDQRGRRPGQYK